MKKTRKQQLEDLYQALSSENKEIRWNASDALERLNDISAVEPLIAALQTEQDYDVRRSIIVALGNIGDKKAVDPLILSLQDENEEVRAYAAGWLGELHDIRAVEPLIKTLKNDEDAYTRMSAIIALGVLKASEANDLIMEALKDKDEGIRYWAADVLGKIGDQKALPALQILVETDTGTIKKGKAKIADAAAKAIEQIKQRQQE